MGNRKDLDSSNIVETYFLPFAYHVENIVMGRHIFAPQPKRVVLVNNAFPGGLCS